MVTTISLGRLFQCLTILSVKKFFLISNLKYAKKSVRPVRDDNKPWPYQEREKEAELKIITQSLSLSKL